MVSSEIPDLVETLKTGAHYPLRAPSGAFVDAPVWLVRSPAAISLFASHEDRTWRFDVDCASDAALLPGLTRDRVRIGPYTLPLERGTKEAADRLLAAFTASAKGAPQTPAPPAPGRTIDDALGVPQWWAETLGGPDQDPWVFAVETQSRVPLMGHDGRTRSAPLLIGLSEARIALAARLEPGISLVEPEVRALTHAPKGVQADGWALTLDDRLAERTLHVAKAQGPRRLATLFSIALEAGRPSAATGLLRRLEELDALDEVGAELAAFSWVHDEAERALRFLVDASGELPDLDRLAALRRKTARALERALDAPRATLVAHVDRIAQRLTQRDVVRNGAPWPPSDLGELLAHAGSARGGPVNYDHLLAAVPEPRRGHVRVALSDGPPAEWRSAAEAYAQVGELETARRLLRRGLASSPSAADWALLAVWSLQADDEEQGRVALDESVQASLRTDPLLPPDGWSSGEHVTPPWVCWLASGPGGPQPPWRKRPDLGPTPEVSRRFEQRQDEVVAIDLRTVDRLADIAAAHARPDLSARLLFLGAAARPLGPGHRGLAARLAEELDAPSLGASIFEALARSGDATASEEAAEDWIRASRARIDAGEPEAARRAMSAAIQSGFLRPDVYRRVLDLGAATLDPAQARWWTYIEATLTGDVARRAAIGPLEPPLGVEALERLHSEELGWLERVKAKLQDHPAPARAELVRGLERMTVEAYPSALDAVRRMSDALRIHPPDCFVYRGEEGFGASVWPLSPPVLLVGVAHLDEGGPRSLDIESLRFLIAVELAHLAADHPILSFETGMLETGQSAYRAFGELTGAAQTIVDVLSIVPGLDQVAKIQKFVTLSRKFFFTKKAVDKFSELASSGIDNLRDKPPPPGIGRNNLDDTALQFRLHADRIALSLTGDLHAAIRAILATAPDDLELLQLSHERGIAYALGQAKTPNATEVLRISSLIADAAAWPLTEPATSSPNDG